jgi:hypothetical protein
MGTLTLSNSKNVDPDAETPEFLSLRRVTPLTFSGITRTEIPEAPFFSSPVRTAAVI